MFRRSRLCLVLSCDDAREIRKNRRATGQKTWYRSLPAHFGLKLFSAMTLRVNAWPWANDGNTADRPYERSQDQPDHTGTGDAACRRRADRYRQSEVPGAARLSRHDAERPREPGADRRP